MSLTPNPAADLYLDIVAKMLTRYDFEGRNVTVKFDAGSYQSYLWELAAIHASRTWKAGRALVAVPRKIKNWRKS